jgi:hypothetical protein
MTLHPGNKAAEGLFWKNHGSEAASGVQPPKSDKGAMEIARSSR